MADILLYDRVGEPVEYNDIDTITVDTPIVGETATFTYGEVVDNPSYVADFSNGNQTISVNEGELLKDLTIEAPGTLTSDNVKRGITIAGVTGTFTGDEVTKAEDLQNTFYPKAKLTNGVISSSGVVRELPTQTEFPNLRVTGYVPVDYIVYATIVNSVSSRNIVNSVGFYTIDKTPLGSYSPRNNSVLTKETFVLTKEIIDNYPDAYYCRFALDITNDDFAITPYYFQDQVYKRMVALEEQINKVKEALGGISFSVDENGGLSMMYSEE